jgi:hypothetical protein
MDIGKYYTPVTLWLNYFLQGIAISKYAMYSSFSKILNGIDIPLPPMYIHFKTHVLTWFAKTNDKI